MVDRFDSITSRETAMKAVMDTIAGRLSQSGKYDGLQVQPYIVYNLIAVNLLEGFRLVQSVPLEKPLEIRRFFGYGPISGIITHDLREIVYADINEKTLYVKVNERPVIEACEKISKSAPKVTIKLSF